MTKQRTIGTYATFFLLLTVGLVVGYANYRHFYPDVQQFGALKGDAPNLSNAIVFDLEGKAAKPADFPGKTVIFALWATWCPSCLKELPQLYKLEKEHGDKLAVMAVAAERNENFRDFLDSREIDYPTLYWDKGLTVFKQLELRGLPTAYIISPEGKVVKKFEGEVDWLTPGMKEILKLE